MAETPFVTPEQDRKLASEMLSRSFVAPEIGEGKTPFVTPEQDRKLASERSKQLFVAPKTEEVEAPFVAPEQERKAAVKSAEVPFASPNPFYVGNPNLNLEIPKAAVEYVNTAPKFVRDLSQKAQEEYNKQVLASAERARTGAVEEDIPILSDPTMGVSFPMPRENIAGFGAVGGAMAEQMLTPLNVAATVASSGLGTVARLAPKALTEAKLLAGGLNVAATAPAIAGAVEAAEASFENPTPQNIGAFFGNTLIAALGGLGIAYDLTFKAPAKFNPAASAAANKATQAAEQATARQAMEAAQIAQEQNNVRAADFLKAKAELHQQAAADLEAALKGGQLAGEETVTLAGTPDQVRLLEIETGKTPGESAREKARILARQPEPLVVDEGLIPPQVELSPQAAALAALEEGKPTPAKSKLLAKPSQPPEGAPSTAGMLSEEPVAAPAAENLPTPPQLEVTRRASGVAASPSIEDINFDRARRNLTSADQASFKLKMQELAPDATVSNAIGDWADGAENSVAAVFDYNKPVEELRRLAASAGLSRDQKAALWWTTDPKGQDAVHFVSWPKDVSIADARQAMIDAGLENRTLTQTADGVQGFVFDGGQQALNKIEQLHEHSTNPSIESSAATGEFPGDFSGRAAARRAYRDILGTPLETKARENLLRSSEVGAGGQPTLTPEINPTRPSLAENPEGWADSVINEKRGQVNAGLDPELFAAYTVKGSAVFARGVRDFSAWSTEMVKEFGEDIRPQLQSLWTSVSRLGDEAGDLSKRIGTRNPTAVSSTETGYGNDTVIGLPALKADPEVLDKMNRLIKAEYPQIRIKPGQSPVDAMVEFVKGNLIWLHDSIAPEMAKKGITEDVTARMREWYNGGRKITNDWSGGFDTPKEGVAGAIAALSPQRDWHQNLSLAERVLGVVKRTPNNGRFSPEMDAKMSSWIMKTKEFDKQALSDKTRAYLDAELLDLRSKPFNELDNWQKAVWARLYSEAHLSKDYNIFSPEGDRLGFATNKDGSRREVSWGSFDQIGNAISIIEDSSKKNISDRLGTEHKVRNFYNNLLLPNDPRFGDVTIDTHAVAAGLLKPLSGTSREVLQNFGGNGGPTSGISGINGTYPVYAEAYRQAAKERGLLPREMQSITWEAVRGLFEATQKTSKAEGALTDLTQKIWKDYAKGNLTLDQARTAILETAGGIESPNWLQSDVGPLADAGATSKRAKLPFVQPSGFEPGGPVGGPAGFWDRTGIEDPAGALSPQATRRSDSLFERAREQGSVDPQLLFSTPVQSSLGAVAGGVYGSTEGDTPEERASNMLKYAGLGAAGGILTSKLGRTAMSRKALTSGPTTEMAKHLTPVEGKPLSQVIKEIPGKLKRDWATVYAPLDKLEKDVAEANAGVVSLVPRAIPLSREFEQVAGAAGKAGQEVRDYATNVIDQVGPKDRRAFDEIVALKRIEQRLAWNDLNQSDRKAVGDWTHQKVQADIDKWQQHLGPQRFAELEDIAVNQFQKAADDALKLQVESGRMSPEQYQAIKQENDFYAPFEVLDWIDSEANVASRPKVGTGVDTMEPLSKKITGIRNELFHLENPTVSLGKQIWKSRILAEKNLKMRELANLADADVSGKYVRKLESWEEPRRGYETVNYFDNGKKMKLEVGPDVAEAVKGMSVGQTGLLSQFAKRFASTFRFGATSASIPFQPVNFAFADQPMLWLVSKYGLKANPKEFIQAPADFASGMYASMFSNLLGGETGAFAKATENLPIVGEANKRAAELARKFNESGASGAVWQDMLDSMGGAVDEKQLMKSLKIGENSILDGVGAMNKFIEESTKLMGFKRGLRIEGIENMTPKQAEEAMKKVVTEVRNYVGSPDFQRAGREARTLNNVVQMFLNARLQGTTNLGARLAGADGAKAASEAWLRTAGTVGTGAAYLWSLNQEPENKPDYEALSAVEKANYFHVPRYDVKDKPIYSTNDRGERSREYFRIPKREILGYFGNTVDAALNFAQDQDPEAAGKFAVQMMESLSPVNVSGKNLTERIESVVGGANPLIKVPYETISGRETFRHRPIVPAGDLQKASAEQQYLPSTPKLFVSAAQAMPEGAPDVLRSPLRLQQLVGGLVGPLVSQFVAKPQSADRDPLAAGLASNPLTARLVSTGYTERADEKAAVEKAETEAADVRVERRREAQNEIDRIRKLPESQRGKAILDLGTEKPEVFKALEKELRYQSEDPITRRIRNLGERDGTRARFIVNRIRELKDPQKVTEFLTRLSEGPEPALTEEVMAQIEALAGVGSSQANTSPRR
jgi:hypothetical protein